MSSPSTPASDSARVAREASEHPDVVASLLKPVEVAGFWAAVALPFLYVPLLVVGVHSPPEQVAAAGLIVLHAVSLLLGRRHHSG